MTVHGQVAEEHRPEDENSVVSDEDVGSSTETEDSDQSSEAPVDTRSAICGYLSSLTDLDHLTDVIAYGLPVAESGQKWTLSDVKTHFEKPPADRERKQGPHLCTGLPSTNVPISVVNLTTGPITLEIQRLVRESPLTLCRSILGEEGSVYTIDNLEYTMWAWGEQGLVMFMLGLLKENGDEDGPPMPLVLYPGDMILVPVNRRVTMQFIEEAMFQTGVIVRPRPPA